MEQRENFHNPASLLNAVFVYNRKTFAYMVELNIQRISSSLGIIAGVDLVSVPIPLLCNILKIASHTFLSGQKDWIAKKVDILCRMDFSCMPL